MSYFQSIRWQVQFWHGGLLVLVLAGFGFTAWNLQRSNQFNRADRELEHRMGMIAKMMGPDRNPPPGKFRDNFPAPPKIDEPLRLPPQEMNAFEGPPGQAFYYVVWERVGEHILKSSSAPANVPCPELTVARPSFRTRGTLRECFHDTPGGRFILIGRDYKAEFDELHRVALLLSLVGMGVLLLGLAGGWWISTRALHPVSDISAAAAKIANGDLGQRIHTKDTVSELGELAQNLNNTFAQLQASFERQAQFTADAAHELRTPLAVMLTQIQSALARVRSPEEYREALAACERAVQRMRSLAENLLVLAHLDSSTFAQQEESCELDQLVRDAVENMKPLTEMRGVHLEMELHPATLRGNPGQLSLVINNLISNAIEYNKPGGCVTIKTRNETGVVVLEVIDTGIGMSSDDLPHIFDRFYRGDKARSNASQHSGLGLAIVKSIVEEHCGRIDVASKLEQGSTFTVVLPLLLGN